MKIWYFVKGCLKSFLIKDEKWSDLLMCRIAIPIVAVSIFFVAHTLIWAVLLIIGVSTFLCSLFLTFVDDKPVEWFNNMVSKGKDNG